MRILRSLRLLGVVLRAIGHTLTLPKPPKKFQNLTMISGKKVFRCDACDSVCTTDATGRVDFIGYNKCPIFVAWCELEKSK